MIGALDIRGVRAMMTIEDGTDAEAFETFLEKVLLRRLRTGDIVVLDNLGAHKAVNVRRSPRPTAALHSRPQPHLALLEQAQGCSEGPRHPHQGGPGEGHLTSHEPHLPRRCRRPVQALWL